MWLNKRKGLFRPVTIVVKSVQSLIPDQPRRQKICKREMLIEALEEVSRGAIAESLPVGGGTGQVFIVNMPHQFQTISG